MEDAGIAEGRHRARFWAAMRHHPALGPLLAPYVDRAALRPAMEQSAWDYGVVKATEAFDRVRSFIGAAQAGLGAVGGVAVTQVDLDIMPFKLLDPWPFQLVFAFVVGVLAYWTVPTLLAVVRAVGAPLRQREEARETARGLGLKLRLRQIQYGARVRELRHPIQRDAPDAGAEFNERSEALTTAAAQALREFGYHEQAQRLAELGATLAPSERYQARRGQIQTWNERLPAPLPPIEADDAQ